MQDKELIELKIMLDKVTAKLIKGLNYGIFISISFLLLSLLFNTSNVENIIFLISLLIGFMLGVIYSINLYYRNFWRELKKKYKDEMI